MQISHKQTLIKLKNKYKNFLGSLRELEWEYNDLMKYMRSNNTLEEAELSFYSDCFDNSGHCTYYEGYFFTFEYKNLKFSLNQNREKRKELVIKIKEAKKNLKEYNNLLSLKTKKL
jgi:hypothetical protein